jgi:hypothetical protein
MKKPRSSSWLSLFKNLKGVKCSPSDDHRQFRSWLGIHPTVAEMAFLKYQHPFFLKKIYLAIVLNFEKNMPNQQLSSGEFKMTPLTYRKWLWQTIHYLDQNMHEVGKKLKLFSQSDTNAR